MKSGNIVKDKSFTFAIRVVRLYKLLCEERREYVLSKQMLRSGTAIGALVRESEHAQSTADFISKLSIALKEANETEYWLMLLHEAEYLTKEEYIEQAVLVKYDEISEQNSWLWIKNVWKSDTNTSQFVDFEDYANHYNLEGEDKDNAKARYDSIVSTIVGDGRDNNGYYVIMIFAVLVSFLTQFLSAKLLAPKGQKMNLTNKIMMAIIPITMLILAMTSNVVFTLYIITNSLMTAIISTIISLVLKKINKNKDDKEILMKSRNVEVVEYSRNYKK